MSATFAQAERFARARLEFVEAMRLGCSIVELRERKVRARQAEHDARLRARTADIAAEAQGVFDLSDLPDESWMMRD